MRSFILAAGRGSRLHPYTADCPKSLTILGGETLIERQLRTLRDAGVVDIIIITGYRAEMLALPGTRQVLNDRWETTNMVESLFAAEAEFGNDLIISYGDIVYESRVLKALLQSPHDISIVVDQQWRSYWEQRFENPLSDAESLRTDDENHIINIGQKVTKLDDIQAQYTGLMRFRAGGIEDLKKAYLGLGETKRPWMNDRNIANAYMTDLLMELILTGHFVHAVPIDGGWLEIDTEHDLKIAQRMLKNGVIDRLQ